VSFSKLPSFFGLDTSKFCDWKHEVKVGNFWISRHLNKIREKNDPIPPQLYAMLLLDYYSIKHPCQCNQVFEQSFVYAFFPHLFSIVV